MENTIWTDPVRDDEMFQSVKVERNILQTVQRRKANWTGHILSRKSLLNRVIERKLEEG